MNFSNPKPIAALPAPGKPAAAPRGPQRRSRHHERTKRYAPGAEPAAHPPAAAAPVRAGKGRRHHRVAKHAPPPAPAAPRAPGERLKAICKACMHRQEVAAPAPAPPAIDLARLATLAPGSPVPMAPALANAGPVKAICKACGERSFRVLPAAA